MHLENKLLPHLRSLALALVLLAAAACASSRSPEPVPPGAPGAPVPAAAPAAPAGFADNPIVYFVMTDRFANGDPSNDHSYGRSREPSPNDDIATFHGGDLRGLTEKITAGWFDALGVNALWITAPYEQIHGWVVGGDKQFKHYAYHGYYALDYTVLDQNMGTPDDLRALVAAAHARGIRVLFDVVMNHPGYLDITTARQLGVKVLWPGAENATIADYHSFIDYNNFNFADWWGRAWVRAGLPGYMDGGQDDLTKQLAYLPDFRTDSKDAVTLPAFLKRKPDTRAVDLPGTTVRGYLIHWLTDWVRTYGIDGFRCDTVKHVEPDAWHELKLAATAALADWKAQHPADKIDDAPFWMVGEFWGHGPARGPLHDAGFDAMINFEFQHRVAPAVAGNLADLDATFADYAAMQHGKPAQMLSYLSSHDTELYDRTRLIDAGSALLLAPGAVQIFYGDETGRPPGPTFSGDPQQATRSDMNWDHPDAGVLAHWRALGSFRKRHVAIARGVHARLSARPYVFSRIDGADRVVIGLAVPAGTALPVAPVFADGDSLRDAATGKLYVVARGSVTIAAAAHAVLLERAGK
ncbi:MAG TPA: alpha-amylase family glycosyl hydrolase [Kofleriaceae bacterium]|nr:alpha-amylase family glycosyl hydrolase [Kofleriaceae bacterium]